MRTIAIVEDDPYISNMLAELLAANGYATLRAWSGSEALLLLERERPDLVILDLMLPGMSGEEVLERIAGSCPVIILSARADVQGKVKSLNAGAVDYVTKPFDNDELLARIGVHLRRGAGERAPLVLGGICMDFDTFEVFVDGVSVRLTKTEFAILRAFLENPRRVFSRSALLCSTISTDSCRTGRSLPSVCTSVICAGNWRRHRPKIIYRQCGASASVSTPPSLRRGRVDERPRRPASAGKVLFLCVSGGCWGPVRKSFRNLSTFLIEC